MRGTALWHILAVQALVAARDECGFTVIHKGGPFHKVILSLTFQSSDSADVTKQWEIKPEGNSLRLYPNPIEFKAIIQLLICVHKNACLSSPLVDHKTLGVDQ